MLLATLSSQLIDRLTTQPSTSINSDAALHNPYSCVGTKSSSLMAISGFANVARQDSSLNL
jgi:hypothetical protein